MNALARGLALLESLAASNVPMGLSELARTTAVDKSTAFRLLSTLRSSGYVVQDDRTKRYRATSKLVALGSAVLTKIELRETARPFLTGLVERTGLNAVLAVPAEGKWHEVMFLDEAVRSSAAIVVNVRVGRLAPSHCTGTGKALLAFASDDRLAEVNGQLVRYTARTLGSGTALRLHLEAVRALGYAVDDEEFLEGWRCVAAPIRNHVGAVIASLGIVGPVAQLTLEDVPLMARLVVDQAGQLSCELGYASRSQGAVPANGQPA